MCYHSQTACVLCVQFSLLGPTVVVVKCSRIGLICDWNSVGLYKADLKTLGPVYTKVDVPNSGTHLSWVPIFVWYVIRSASKNGY